MNSILPDFFQWQSLLEPSFTCFFFLVEFKVKKVLLVKFTCAHCIVDRRQINKFYRSFHLIFIALFNTFDNGYYLVTAAAIIPKTRLFYVDNDKNHSKKVITNFKACFLLFNLN
jgi:hypothetical protein